MMRHGYYRRLLLSYMPIFFSVFAIMILLIVLGSNYLSREAAKKEGLAMARFIGSAIDRELESAEQVVYSELLDKSKFILLSKLNPAEDPYYSTYELSVMLRNITVNYPVIDSIYIYRYANRSVQSMNVTSSLERFGDKDFIGEVAQSDNINLMPWTGARDYREFEGQRPAKVVSFVRPIPFLREVGGLIVINVRTDDLLRIVGQLSDPDSTFVTIADASGGTLLEAGAERVAADATSTSSYTGYSVRLGYRESMLAGILDTMIVLVIAIGFMIVGLGLLWMLYTTKRNYRPIRAIVAKIEQAADRHASHESGTGKDEFGFVEQVLERMMKQSTAFEQQHKENAAIKRRIFFSELREGCLEGPEAKIRQQLATHGWAEEGGGFMMAVAEIDRYDAFSRRYSERDQSLLKFALFNAIAESDHTCLPSGAWADWVAGNRIAALYPLDRSAFHSPEEVARGLRQAADWVERHLNLTVTVGIGNPVREAGRIRESYDEAQRMLPYKFALGTNRIIASGDVAAADRSGHLPLVSAVRELAEGFRLGVADWPGRFDGWLNGVCALLAPKKEIDMLLGSLLYHVRREIEPLPGAFAQRWDGEFAPAMERCLCENESLTELRQAFRNAMTEAWTAFAGMRESGRHNGLLHAVRDHIDLHYTDPNLSLAYLSDLFDMNEKTLSRLFREQFGVNFIDYLIGKRLERAKLLLLQTEDSIQHISRQVGYLNSLSFTRAFKKLVGMTPLDLRKS